MGEPSKTVNFFDGYGMPHPDHDQASENGVLYFTEMLILGMLNGGNGYPANPFYVSNKRKYAAMLATFHLYREKGKYQGNRSMYKQTPWGDGRDRASHDNATAIASISALALMDGSFALVPMKILGEYWHPRDIGFYLKLRGNPILIWFTYLTMIWSCLRVYKTRNGVKMVATDSKLLAWLRLRTLEIKGDTGWMFRMTRDICDGIIKKKFGGWGGVFCIYFKNPMNPVRRLAMEVYP